MRGWLFALTGKASDAVRAITSGLTSLRSSGATLYEPYYLSYLATAHAELGQPDDSRRCIDDAIEKVERSKERWYEAEVIALPVKSRSSRPSQMLLKRKHISSAHSRSHVSSKQNPGNSARQ